MTTQPADTNILQRIEEWARREPSRPAIREGEQSLTFGELDTRANRLANLLRSLGADAEVTVAVCLERSLALPTAMLAVQKAGAAYVPLDPSLPDGRRALVLQETAPRVIVTERRFRAQFDDSATPVICIDTDDLETYSDATPPRSDDPTRLACIIYTSGSTGRPGGVELEQGTLSARYALSPYATLLAPDDVLAAVTAIGWAPSVYEHLFALATGACIAVADASTVRDPARLATFLTEHRVRFMRAVPSLWQALVDDGWRGNADLKIVCHGEPLPAALGAQLATRGRGVWNTFGATEATAFSLVTTMEDGRRLVAPSEWLRVLDTDGRPIPEGEPGEIYIGGALVARGYREQPERTGQRFIVDPRDDVRLFRTGDLARVRVDGTLELLGRADRQVKLRGQRIELGEVEVTLERIQGVREAVALARADARGEARLVAYVVAEQVTSETLRASLRRVLPEFMVPAAFVTLDALPRNANGKVDVSALPAPNDARVSRVPFVPPESPFEHAITRIVGECLGIDGVGIDDDFFELGGHSLQAARVASRIRGACDLELDLATFYAAPTVRAVAAELDQRKARGDRATVPAIVPTVERENVPLSHAQERLWFLDRLSPDEVAYSLPSALRLGGPLDVAALRASLDAILARHEALRTRFTVDGSGTPRQSVVPARSLDVRIVDLTHLDADEREAIARDDIAREAARPFELSEAPLLRASVYRLGPNDHVLFTNMHHIASDGWSKAVFRRELALHYEAALLGRAADLPSLRVQYADYAAWQRRPSAQVELARQLVYWRRRLDGVTPTALPTDRPRPRVFSHRGARETLVLPRSLLDALHAVARAHDASLSMVLLATFDVLLVRHTGQDDLAVGSPIAGRNAPELEDLVGFFVNTLVLRTHVDPGERFADLLARVKAVALEAYAHQDLPFERLVSELNPERDLARHPLVQTILAVQNTPYDDSALKDLHSEVFPFREEATRFDLELHVWERDEGLRCHLIYAVDLFDAWRMQQFLRQFERLLEQVAATPEAAIATLSLLAQGERTQLLDGWNQTARDFPRNRCIHELVAEQAARTPDALAIARGGERLTYTDLDARANRLAHEMQARGVGAGARVVLGLEMSPEFLVGALATLKAGAAYVPLDPDYPVERLALMLEDCAASLVLTREALAPRFHPRSTPTFLVDSDAASLTRHSALAPHADVTSDAPAYVLYTSGTTGRPNGVEVPHRALVNLATWTCSAFSVGPADRMSLVASPSFDASVWELWPSLCAGASLHVPDRETRISPAAVAAWIVSERLTGAFLPTPLLEACIDDARLAASSLRFLFTGGDRLTRRPPRDWQFSLVNLYGPAEATVVTTMAVVPPAAGTKDALPTIGRPISNAQCFVLDPAMQPVPVGVGGELYIGGEGVALGYVARPELTTRRFVTSPFGTGRLYRTGDLARWRPDGELEFLGRLDQQVKLRGMRIEPAEIDATIRAVDGVKEALTIAREDAPGQKRLVSYVVTAEGESLSLARAQVARWQKLYEAEYGGNASSADVEFDITGWNSSLTGGAIPASDMREWVDTTVAAIRGLGAERILEIGCGTGLLLFPLARSTREYTATDFSSAAIARIARRSEEDARLAGRVTLAATPAHDLVWLGDRTFDAVVINSVVQYFPSAAYLVDVLAQAVERLAPGGRLFVGDVRNLDLFDTFHQAVVTSRSPGLTRTEQQERVALSRQHDKELLLAPAWFEALRERIPRITAVEIRPKRGRARHEMNLFRFDVTLRLDTPVRYVEARSVTWMHDVAALESLLIGAPAEAFLVSGFVDDRVSPWISSRTSRADDLEALHELATRMGRRLELRFGFASRTIDALFAAIGDDGGPLTTDAFEPAQRRAPGAALVSDPLAHVRAAETLAAVREHLARMLPTHMQPSAIVLLDALPLSPNGKIDRRRLPPPASDRVGTDVGNRPVTATERTVAELFAHALGLDAVGRHENFFALGGHSLLAVQVMTRVHDALGVELPLAALFEAPTVDRLAARVDAARPLAVTRIDEAPDLRHLPLTPADAHFHYGRIALKAGWTSWYQVLELGLSRVDPERLAAAVLHAVNLHPIARGRLSAPDALGPAARWEVSPHRVAAPLDVIACTDERAAHAAVERVVQSPFPLDEAPSVRFALVRVGAGGRLLLRYNHGAIDGSGLTCLLNSIAARYVGRDEPSVRTTPFTTTELLAHHGREPRTGLDGIRAWMQNNELSLLAGSQPNARKRDAVRRLVGRLGRPRSLLPGELHGEGGDANATDSARVEFTFTDADTALLTSHAKRLSSTLDRLFLVGLVRGAVSWNERFSDDAGPLEFGWAVNLRPPRYFGSIVANHFAWSRVRAPRDGEEGAWERTWLDPATDGLLRGALDWAELVDAFHARDLPLVVRKAVLRAGRLSAPSMLVSNTLPFPPLESGDLARELGVVRSRHHARYAFTERPALVIAREGDRLQLRMIFARRQFDERGALHFLEHCGATLVSRARGPT